MRRYSLREFILFIALLGVLTAWCIDRLYLVSQGMAAQKRIITLSKEVHAKTGMMIFRH